jgi:hypothetical protein
MTHAVSVGYGCETNGQRASGLKVIFVSLPVKIELFTPFFSGGIKNE